MWDDYIHHFDSFGDNKGGARIGFFLNDLIEGFNNKLKKDIVLENAIQKYIKKWGEKFVIKYN